MNNVLWTILGAVFSGIAATFVTMGWQEWSQRRNERLRIFNVLMSKRYDLPSEENVDAMNLIDVVFHKDTKVRGAWKEFNDATQLPDSPSKEQSIRDKHLRLLEVMAEAVGYREINWENIKQYYFPKGLSDRKTEEAVLRKVQIDSALAQIKNGQANENVSQVSSKEQMTNQVLLAALQNPEGFSKLYEVIEKAQTNNKISRNHR